MNADSDVKCFPDSFWVGDLPLAAGLGDHMLRDLVQIVGNDAPADPAFHPIRAVVAAAVEPMPALEPADAAFDAGAPIAATPEPTLALVCHPRRALAARPRQHHLFDPTLLRSLFIRRRRQFAITG